MSGPFIIDGAPACDAERSYGTLLLFCHCRGYRCLAKWLTFGSQQQWMETLHWQMQHFRQEQTDAQILRFICI
jgi:hypothetical protein